MLYKLSNIDISVGKYKYFYKGTVNFLYYKFYTINMNFSNSIVFWANYRQ